MPAQEYFKIVHAAVMQALSLSGEDVKIPVIIR